MPFYEYYCPTCKKRVSIFWRSISEARKSRAVCPDCDSPGLERRVSRFRRLSSRPAGTGDLPFSESDLQDLEREDPRAMARLFRRMSEETGEAIEPEMEEVIGRLEKGEDPEKIERELESSQPSPEENTDD